MRKQFLISICIMIIILSFKAAFGQTDPTVLGGEGIGSTAGAPAWSGDSGYVHKKKKKQKRAVASDSTPGPNASPVPKSSPLPNETGFTRLPPPEIVESPRDPNSSPTAAPTPTATPTFSAKVKEVVMGGDEESVQSYKSFLEDQDIRRNFFELSLATGYLYNTSQSSYFFKNYNDSGPTADLNADIWISPFLGITGEYKSTLLNQVSDSAIQNNFISVTQSWFDIGLKFRRFFGMTINAPSLTVGLRYMQYQFNSPQSSLARAKLTNQGPELDLDLTLPLTKNSFWTVGLNVQPFDSLAETSGAAVRSGLGNQTIGFGISTGSEYRFSRQTTAFLKLSATVQATSFTGSASNSDPISGITPSNVPVSNVFYLLDLGIRFGH